MTLSCQTRILVLKIGLLHGVLHNHAGNSSVSPKLWLKSILLFYKDLLEIKICLVEAIFEQKF